MPRPGSPQQPRFKRGDSLAYGEASAANEMVDAADAFEMPMVASEQEFVPQTPQDTFLFAPTDRPDEPITAGAPFGPGPSSPRTYETSDQFMRRVNSVLSRTGKMPPEVKAFLDRAAAGE